MDDAARMEVLAREPGLLQQLIEEALEKYGGNMSALARAMGVSQSAVRLYRGGTFPRALSVRRAIVDFLGEEIDRCAEGPQQAPASGSEIEEEREAAIADVMALCERVGRPITRLEAERMVDFKILIGCTGGPPPITPRFIDHLLDLIELEAMRQKEEAKRGPAGDNEGQIDKGSE